MPFYRKSSFGLPLLLLGCANLIGLTGYSVDEGSDNMAGDGDGAGGLGGGILATGGGDPEGTGGNEGLCEPDCDDENPCTQDSCQGGKCVFEPLGAGVACTTGVCSQGESPECVRCIDDEPEERDVDTGCAAGTPQCARIDGALRCIGCQSDQDCDPGGECTVTKCEESMCVETHSAQGAECSDGVCDSGACVECVDDDDCDGGHCSEGACLECIEDEHCGDLFCSSGSCVACRGDDDCVEGVCSNDGRCVACVDAEDCDDDVECTHDECVDETCSNTPDNKLCPDSDDVCLQNICDESLGCQTEDISRQEVLIDQGEGDGSFELRDGSWFEFGSEVIIFDGVAEGVNDNTAASHGDWFAWFGGIHGEVGGGIYQLIDLPEGTTTLSLVADASFQTEQRAGNDDTVQFQITDLANEELLRFGGFSAEDAMDDGSMDWTIDGVALQGDASSLAGRSNVRLRIVSQTDDEYFTDFFIDDVRLTATVCRP